MTAKHQAPSTKHQRKSNRQTSNWGTDYWCERTWDLDFGVSLEVGTWNLEVFW
jgi:hypothetical protein